MLDLHALYNGTGSTTLSSISVAANIPSLDGQSAPGVPIAPGAILKAWGVATTIADTIKEAKLVSQDQIDSINGEYFNPTSGVNGIINFDTFLPYRSGGRTISYSQNTGAAPVFAFTLDQYPAPIGANPQKFSQSIKLPQVFGGALTAGAWGSVPVAPTSNIPAGKYAILGAYLSNVTNYALLRFRHADFGGKIPGFPAVDVTKAAARAVLPPGCPLFNMPGLQFIALGDCPTFQATSNGTGLTVDALSITADTPNVVLNLVQLSP